MTAMTGPTGPRPVRETPRPAQQGHPPGTSGPRTRGLHGPGLRPPLHGDAALPVRQGRRRRPRRQPGGGRPAGRLRRLQRLPRLDRALRPHCQLALPHRPPRRRAAREHPVAGARSRGDDPRRLRRHPRARLARLRGGLPAQSDRHGGIRPLRRLVRERPRPGGRARATARLSQRGHGWHHHPLRTAVRRPVHAGVLRRSLPPAGEGQGGHGRDPAAHDRTGPLLRDARLRARSLGRRLAVGERPDIAQDLERDGVPLLRADRARPCTRRA